MNNTLIVTTAYDRDSAITRRWAELLRAQLLNRNIPNILVDGSALNQSALKELLTFADYFIFFGHGSQSELISRPSKGFGTDVPLIDSTTSGTLLSGSPVFAVCCDARSLLGPACPQGFVGYDSDFPVKESAEAEFGAVVVNGAISFVGGTPLAQLASSINQMWLRLAADFDINTPSAMLKSHPDAAWAKTVAEDLATGIGKEP